MFLNDLNEEDIESAKEVIKDQMVGIGLGVEKNNAITQAAAMNFNFEKDNAITQVTGINFDYEKDNAITQSTSIKR